MLKKILLVLAALIAVFVVYVALQPAAFSVARSIEISAPPEKIFPHVNSLKKFNDWSPWAKLDPNSKMEFSGPDEGEGAVAKWKGNHEVGEGTMTITKSTPHSNVEMSLEFVEPMPGIADVDFKLEPTGQNTNVTWAMSSSHGFIERAICTLMMINPEKMIGEKYEEGLANLKKLVEGQV